MPHGRPRRKKPHPGRTDDLFGGELACDPLFFERRAREAGFTCIAGLDEAGRGPLAGPVVAAAVVLPEGLLIPGLTDSKQVAEPDRERLFDVIREQALCFGVGIADERTIDEVNILQATIIAMEQALELLEPRPDYLLLDALTLPRVPLPQKPLVKGDCRGRDGAQRLSRLHQPPHRPVRGARAGEFPRNRELFPPRPHRTDRFARA